MLNLLGFSFNYIDVVCFVAIYCLLATYFGNKIFYASKMQHIEYTYSVICILAITICANPLSSSPTMLSSINQIMLILMLLTFLFSSMLVSIVNPVVFILLESLIYLFATPSDSFFPIELFLFNL